MVKFSNERKFVKIICVLLVVIMLPVCGFSQLNEAQQLIVAIADDWDSQSGSIHLFEKSNSGWIKHRFVFPVSFGKNGLAWGKGLHPEQKGDRMKQEGDQRSPAGIFDIESRVYGINPESPEGVRLPYYPLTEWTRCVDDPASRSYNKILEEDSAKDWISAERLKAVDPDYQYILVVHHNPARTPGEGSCIFLHVNNVPTVGCTSMDEADMLHLLRWLDPKKRGMFIQLPHAEYHRLRTEWELPALVRR